MTKERRQILLLGLILAIIAGVLLYMYGNQLLPQPDGMPAQTAISKLQLPATFDDPLFARPDFQALKPAQGVPVKPFTDIPRNAKLFEKPE